MEDLELIERMEGLLPLEKVAPLDKERFNLILGEGNGGNQKAVDLIGNAAIYDKFMTLLGDKLFRLLYTQQETISLLLASLTAVVDRNALEWAGNCLDVNIDFQFDGFTHNCPGWGLAPHDIEEVFWEDAAEAEDWSFLESINEATFLRLAQYISELERRDVQWFFDAIRYGIIEWDNKYIKWGHNYFPLTHDTYLNFTEIMSTQEGIKSLIKVLMTCPKSWDEIFQKMEAK